MMKGIHDSGCGIQQHVISCPSLPVDSLDSAKPSVMEAFFLGHSQIEAGQKPIGRCIHCIEVCLTFPFFPQRLKTAFRGRDGPEEKQLFASGKRRRVRVGSHSDLFIGSLLLLKVSLTISR